MPTKNDQSREVTRRILAARRSQNHALDLSALQIEAIPEEVFQLANLKEINLRHNQISAIPDSLGQLTNLQVLDLTSNKISSFPDSLGQLADLQMLYLSENTINIISDSLGQLANLQQLYLGQNTISIIPDSLSQLSNLQQLDLRHNMISIIPDSIGQLSNLRQFDLRHNTIGIIPDSIGQLSNLQQLYLYSNEISSIPDSIGQLSNLQQLDLRNNKIRFVPDSLGQLANLRQLGLSRNTINSIPDSLGQLANLHWLDLSENQMSTLSDSLNRLPKLTALFLHGNQGLGIPDEILGLRVGFSWGEKMRPPREILNYFQNLRDAKPLNEAKLIMVGPGAVGKTSLVKTLKRGNFNSREKTTEGIKIEDWKCPVEGSGEVKIHIWDFGGQELMHATHQFFLTARSLYLLVLNRRQGGCDREADYWFRLIRAFGGKDAPVIVVLNKQKSEPFDVNRGDWLEKYTAHIKGFVTTDCTDQKSMTELKQKIQVGLQGLQSLKTRFPRRWFAIKDELTQMPSEYLTFEDYRAVCRRHGEQDPEKQTELAGFLHALGIALNYKDDPRLRYAYVLKPEWVTGGVYKLLHSFAGSQGVFSRADGERLLAKEGYSSEAAGFIIGLMEQFELAFSLGDSREGILIPQLLEDQQPQEAGSFDPKTCLNFGYQYEVVPEGLLPRFIVRTHHMSDPKTRWKSGVILGERTGACKALVRANSTASQVRICIDGPESLRGEMLAVVRHNFDAIHADYEFRPHDLVYPPGVPEEPQRIDKLEALARSGSTTVDVVLADSSVIRPSIADMLGPLKASRTPLKLFLSYAHKDAKYLDELRKDLKLMERDGLVRLWSDHGITAGEKWEARILEELNQADVIVCQLSRDFLASDFCVLTELDTAIKRKQAGTAQLIAYLLKACSWEQVENLKQFQLLPRGMKPHSKWRDKDEYWQTVTRGIRKVVEKMQKERPREHRRFDV